MADLNWPGLALGYVGYRGVRAVYNRMPGYKRKSNAPVNKFGFRNKIRRKSNRGFGGGPRRSMYNKHNDLDTKFCVLKLHEQFTTAVTGEKLGLVKIGQLQACPAWTYYSNLFNRYKVQWMRFKLHSPTDVAVMYTYVSMDDVDAPSSRDHILRSQSARVHDVCQNRYAPGRTLKLRYAEAFNDFLDVDMANADIGNVDTAGSKKCKIGYSITGQYQRELQLSIEFGVTFRGLKDDGPTHDSQ